MRVHQVHKGMPRVNDCHPSKDEACALRCIQWRRINLCMQHPAISSWSMIIRHRHTEW